MGNVRWDDECSATETGDVCVEHLFTDDVVPAGPPAMVREIEVSTAKGWRMAPKGQYDQNGPSIAALWPPEVRVMLREDVVQLAHVLETGFSGRAHASDCAVNAHQGSLEVVQ
jgi:hypothetical protein